MFLFRNKDLICVATPTQWPRTNTDAVKRDCYKNMLLQSRQLGFFGADYGNARCGMSEAVEIKYS